MGRERRDNVVRGRFTGRRKMRDPERKSDASASDPLWSHPRTGFRGLGEQQQFQGKRRRRQRTRWAWTITLWAGAALIGTAWGAGWIDSFDPGAPVAAATDAEAVRASFSLCHTGGGTNCVVDGDSIWLQGQNIRIADIDAPETHEPRCPEELALGNKATLRLQQLVNGGTVSLQTIDRDEDSYGRKLRIVLVDGESVGDTLVSEGSARWYARGRRPWC